MKSFKNQYFKPKCSMLYRTFDTALYIFIIIIIIIYSYIYNFSNIKYLISIT